MSLISYVKVQSLDYKALKEAIKNSLKLVHFNLNRNVDKIIIKPNMCFYYHPSTGEVTDPRFVSALIDVIRDNYAKNSEILIVESDASAMKCKYAFSMLGYDRMAEEKDVELINLSEGNNRCIELKINDSQLKFYVPELFYESHLLVNVPKIKYMRDVKITCALKNMFGCNAYSRKYIYHRALNEAIVGINKLIKTDLVVVDGLIVSGMYTKRLDLVMSSVDPVAVDAAASRLMGIDPKSVNQVDLATKEGIGNSEFYPVGDFSYFQETFPKKVMKDQLRETVASYYLRIFQ